MIAAPRSGSGKTTVTLGLLRALSRRNLKVGAAKCGPDYIDPAFHKIATGRESFNLDSWTMPEALLDTNFSRSSTGADIVIAEGSMGLFDGVATIGASGNGASSDIAARYGLPVILVIDTSGQSQSAGAVALGFKHFNPDVTIAGVILGNVASERHRMLAVRGVERAGIAVLGALPRGGVPTLPERHLGLVQAQELPHSESMIDALADAMEKLLDMDAIIACATLSSFPRRRESPLSIRHSVAIEDSRLRGNDGKSAGVIALACDVAFSFTYAHMLANWHEAGAVILPFSPLADEAPSPDADMCWLPGGYPELYASQLSGNRNFIAGLQNFAKTSPIHGECGGYMVLGEIMIDAHGKEWNMTGLLPLTTSFAKRKLHLGYRAVTMNDNSIIRGHEFHYASIVAQGASDTLGTATDANGTSLGTVGQRIGNVTGTFFHQVAAHA